MATTYGSDNVTAAQKERLKKAAFYAKEDPSEFVDALMDVLRTATAVTTA